MPAHLTGGKGGGAMENWPTPNQSDMYYAQVGEKESSHDIGKGYLRAEVKIRGKGGGAEVKWRTPDTCAGGAMNQRHLDKTVDDLKKGISPHTLRLQDQVKDERLWPTPRSQEPGRTSVGYGRGLAELVEGKKQKGEGNPMIEQIKNAKKVVLLEPPYKRKYIPLGLSKIATMVKNNGGKVDHQREYIPNSEDLVCITSLFTYDSEKVLDTIQRVKFLNPKVPIIIGGVYASLMSENIQKYYPDVQIFKGYSKKLDITPPDYSIDWGVDDPWDKFSFVFTSRGCPNKCGYCAVWRIEPEMWINPMWRSHIDLTKPNVMISDNNLSAQPDWHLRDVCEFLKLNKLRVVFDNGFDCKHITDDMADRLASLKYVRSGMRLAFDRIGEDRIFQTAVKRLLDAGVPKAALMAYCIFNFKDKPQEADYRMRECVKLGIRPYPQQYTPLNTLNRKTPYIGQHWTKNLLRVFRYFYLMAGFYTKMTFEEYVKECEIKPDDKYKLTEEDWIAWKK